jgi:hypothetical protein
MQNETYILQYRYPAKSQKAAQYHKEKVPDAEFLFSLLVYSCLELLLADTARMLVEGWGKERGSN